MNSTLAGTVRVARTTSSLGPRTVTYVQSFLKDPERHSGRTETFVVAHRNVPLLVHVWQMDTRNGRGGDKSDR